MSSTSNGDERLSDLLPMSLVERFGRTTDAEQKLRELYETGRQTWPNLRLSEREFTRYLVPRLESFSSFQQLPIPDLFLCAACCSGDPSAVTAFEQSMFPGVQRTLRKLRLSEEAADELQQRLRERLFVRSSTGHLKLQEYSGRGILASWLNVVVINIAHNLQRSDGRSLRRDSEVSVMLAEAVPNPELRMLKELHRAKVEQVIQDAIVSLRFESRQLLRLHFVDQLSIDKIALLYSIHRATAARRIAKTVEELRSLIQKLLMDRLGLDPQEYQSLMRFVRSQLELHLQQWLT